MKRRDPFALLLALAVLVACAWPDLKVSFGILGGSPGSETQGANLFVSELLGIVFGFWALLRRRATLSSQAWWVAGLMLALGIPAALQGLHLGWDPRNIAAEARFMVLAGALLAMASLEPADRRLLRLGLFAGIGLYALQQALLVALEPSGLVNLNVLPLPAASSSHDLAQQAQLGILILGLGMLSSAKRRALLAAVALWVLIWLSYLRALWLALPIAAVIGVAYLMRRADAATAWRYLRFQVLALGLGLLTCLAGLWALNPDGYFLMLFRLHRTAQALHVAPPTALHPSVPVRCSPLLKAVVARGGLYYPLGSTLRDQPISQDPSAFDRGLMRRQAWTAFKNHPGFGSGLGTLFKYQVNATTERLQRDPHNGYAWLAAKCGLWGLGIAMVLLGGLVRALVRGPADGAAIAALALLVVLDIFQVSWLLPVMLLPCLVLLSASLSLKGIR